MSSIKRFEPINTDGTHGLCAEDSEGAYAEYSDYAALEAECDALRAELAALKAPAVALRPSLPTAGVEDVEVVGWRHSVSGSVTADPVRASTWLDVCICPLMTVAQHQRIVAALSGGERVPRELLERIREQLNFAATARKAAKPVRDELRALLAQAEQGGGV